MDYKEAWKELSEYVSSLIEEQEQEGIRINPYWIAGKMGDLEERIGNEAAHRDGSP